MEVEKERCGLEPTGNSLSASHTCKDGPVGEAYLHKCGELSLAPQNLCEKPGVTAVSVMPALGRQRRRDV